MASIGLDSCLNPWLFLLGLVGDKIFPVYIFNTIETPSRPNLLSPKAKVASASSRGEKLQRAYNNLK